MAEALGKNILSVSKLLAQSNLTIPGYQRPYKWTERNISQLFQDLDTHQEQSAYRLGTVVFHKHTDKSKVAKREYLNIVDGQQRTLTLFLAVHAIIEQRLNSDKPIERQALVDQLTQLKGVVDGFIGSQQFDNVITQKNLKQNYLVLKRLVSRHEFTEKHIDFLLNKCEVVTFTLHDVSEAFQFFDSQNARGKDLDPHDLLKAYHLREFSDTENDLKGATVATWESLENRELSTLFSKYLYRIRQWALGNSARYFGKNEVGLFKGVNIDKVDHFPYVESLRISHHYVDHFNQQYQRKIDGQYKAFPFHLDQMIINGRRFFEMAEHYQKQVNFIIGKDSDVAVNNKLNKEASKILATLNCNDLYPKRVRTGDRYVRSIFDCALIFYIDKFGDVLLSEAIEKLFIWAYSLRIKQQVLQLATMDNYVLSKNVFGLIKEAIKPSEVLNMTMDTLTITDNKNNRSNKDNSAEEVANKDPLVNLFKEMNYYE